MKLVVWDIPTRVFHWSLVAAVVFTYVTSRNEYYLELHATAGYAALGLVIFRLLWGFSGNRYARFSQFVKGWGEVRASMRGLVSLKPERYLGHNPLVGWVVVLMLAVIAVITLAGVVTYSGEEAKGVFAGQFSFATAQYARAVHIALAYGFIVIIVAHVCAALVHEFYFKESIITSMITGGKDDPESYRARLDAPGSAASKRPVRLAALIFLSMLGGWALFSFTLKGSGEPALMPPVKLYDDSGALVEFVPDELWQGECGGSCHNAFHPTLLPGPSWVRVMAGLDDHFGDDASLDPGDAYEILKFLLANSAERSTSEASQKILWSLKSVPLKVTDTPYWKKKHSKIKAEVYEREEVSSPSNCAGCHTDADTGQFEDRNIKVPKAAKR